MLDPMAALGLVGNIVQFVDFSIKLVGKAHEIHKSVDGALAENLDTETVARTLRKLQSKLKIDEKHNMTYDSETEGLLEGLCESCDGTAKELLDILEGFKAQGKMTPWKSMRHAIKNVKGKAAVLEISARLWGFRKLLDTTILVELRKTIDFYLVANSASFKTLEASTQNIILAVNENRSVFTTVIETKAAELKALHEEEAVLSAARHEAVNATIIATVTETKEQHETTRREIAIRAVTEAAEMKAHMDKRTDEIKDLIIATQKAKGKTERKRLMEKTNAATASLAAMDLIYNSLVGILAQTDPNHGRHFWKLSPNDYRKPVENVSRSRTQPDQPNSQTVVDLPSSRPVSMAPNPYPSEYLPEVRPDIPPPKLRPYTISIDGRSSTDSSRSDLNFSDPSASSGEDDISFQTDSEIKTPEQRTHRVPARSIPRDFNAKTAGPRKKHSAKPNVTWHDVHEDEMMYFPPPPMPSYGYQGYQQPPPHQRQVPYYPQLRPPSEGSRSNSELEKKLLEVEALMKAQKIDYEKARKEIAARDAEKAAREAAELAAKQKAAAEAYAAKRSAEERAAWEERLRAEKEKLKAEMAKAEEEKAAWEKKFEQEKKTAQARGAENAKKQIEAERKEAEQKAAEEKARADAKAAVLKAEADAKAVVEKAEAEAKVAIEKAEKEVKELKELKEALEKAEKEAKEAVDKAEKDAKTPIDKAMRSIRWKRR